MCISKLCSTCISHQGINYQISGNQNTVGIPGVNWAGIRLEYPWPTEIQVEDTRNALGPQKYIRNTLGIHLTTRNTLGIHWASRKHMEYTWSTLGVRLGNTLGIQFSKYALFGNTLNTLLKKHPAGTTLGIHGFPRQKTHTTKL